MFSIGPYTVKFFPITKRDNLVKKILQIYDKVRRDPWPKNVIEAKQDTLAHVCVKKRNVGLNFRFKTRTLRPSSVHSTFLHKVLEGPQNSSKRACITLAHNYNTWKCDHSNDSYWTCTTFFRCCLLLCTRWL